MWFSLLSDRLLAGGCIRPSTAVKGLKLGFVAPQRLFVALTLVLSGLVLEPFAWLQSFVWGRRLQTCVLPDDPIIVIGHWRSGTTYLHQLLAADPSAATARNALTVAPQIALLLKPLLYPLLKQWMTVQRPIDAVLWGPDDPQEDEVGLARLTMDTNMAGIAFPQNYPGNFRRCVLNTTREFEHCLLSFTRLTWLHEGVGKHHLVIKNSAHSARIPLLLNLFPRARFVFLKREPMNSIRSLVQVKQRLAQLVGLQAAPSACRQVEETVTAHTQLMQAFEQSRHLIPEGQLVEIAYEDLVQSPLETVMRIYSALNICGWSKVHDVIASRIASGKSYRAQPVVLEPEAEQHLQALLS